MIGACRQRAASTHGDQCGALIGAAQFVQRGGDQPAAGAADGVAQRDGAAIASDVDLLHVGFMDLGQLSTTDATLPAVTVQTVGPTLQVYGTELQKKKFLPATLAADVHFAIGYSEHEAGTDLASPRTSAVRHGDEYIINGQKIWTTGGHDADYVWLARRTQGSGVVD